MDLETFNRDWLQCWTDKSVDGILAFYHPDIRYYDEGAPDGLTGKDALRAYFTAVFAAVGAWEYRPELIWTIEGGYCGRWYMDMEAGGQTVLIRGFDMCLLKDGLIVHNEVYTHKLTKPHS